MVNTLTQQNRAQQLLIRRDTKQQGEKLFRLLDWNDLDGSFPAFAVPAAAMVQENRLTSAGVAAAYFRRLRASKGIRTSFDPVIEAALNVDQFTAAIHSTSVAAIKTSAKNGVTEDVAMANALSVTKGALARLVLSAGRDTVLSTVRNDGRATGWERVLGGEGCPFCQELAGRIYRSENADFEAHGNCACSAEPVFE